MTSRSSTRIGSKHILLLSLTAAVVFQLAYTSCTRAPLRGPNYGATSAAHVYDDHVPAERAGEPTYRLILAGDAGAVGPNAPLLAMLKRWGDHSADRTMVLFLGDNVYPAGLQENDAADGKATLRRLLGATDAFKLFLPGNHDWGFRRQQTHRAIVGNQQEFIEQQEEAADFRPKDGCPGPDLVQVLDPGDGLEGGLSLVLLDLHWWLLPAERRPPCRGIESTQTFVEQLAVILEAHRGRNLVIAAHHPLKTAGPHGGHTRGFLADLVVAIIYRFYTIQDVLEPNYSEMVGILSKVLAENPPLAVVAGHDHNLQVMDGGETSRLAIVSGSFSRVTTVTAIEETLFAHAHLGFMVMDFYGSQDGRDTLVVRVLESGQEEEQVFTAAYDLQEPELPPAVEAADGPQ